MIYLNKIISISHKYSLNVLFVVISLILFLTFQSIPRLLYGNNRIYEKEVPTTVIDNFLSEEMIQELQDWIKSEQRFSSNVVNTARGVVSVGEEELALPDGSCLDKDYVSYDGKICHYNARSNVFRHYIITGGFYGAKETIDKLSSSVYSFYPESLLSGNYYPHEVNNPIVGRIFDSDKFQIEAKKLCKEGLGHESTNDEDIVYRPLKFNIHMMPPGMDLPLHWDNQWYWGVNERSSPNWLLHAMKESGLFEDIIIPQAQGVAYLHGIKEEPVFGKGGRYIYYPNGPGAPAKLIKPKRGQAIIMDGGRTIHGVERTHPGVVNKYLSKNAFNRMEFQGNDTWYLLSNDDLIDVYETKDFRITLTWRGLCFRSQEEERLFDQQISNKDFKDNIEILKILDNDMHQRGELPEEKNINTLPRKEFIDALQQVYMPYPIESFNAWIPINYCAYGNDKWFIKVLLKPFCQDIHIVKTKNDQYPEAKAYNP